MPNVKLIVLCGLPGSGKSTYAKKLAKKEHARIISSDYIRKELFGDENCQENGEKVFGRLFYKVKCSLKYEHSTIIDCINGTPSSRKGYLRRYHGMYDESVCVFMNTPTNECKNRNRNRDRVVPEDAIDKQASKFIPPSCDEGFDKIVVISSN